MTYQVILAARARRALSEVLPEAIAAACWEFLHGPLARNPHRVDKPLRGHLEGRYSARRGEFRVVFRIREELVVVEVIDLRHRRDAAMRTTVDLTPAVHRRALEIAKRTGQSLSAVVAELTVRGLCQLDVPVVIATDERSGFPVIGVGRRVTSEQVAAALDEE